MDGHGGRRIVTRSNALQCAAMNNPRSVASDADDDAARARRDGLVKRTAFATIPPRVDYELTPLGQYLKPALETLAGWARAQRAGIESAQRLYDESEWSVSADILITVAQAATEASSALHDGGYATESETSGEAAIAELEANSPIRALVTDINLIGERTGWHVARRARELFPDLPVIYVTSVASEEWSSQGCPRAS